MIKSLSVCQIHKCSLLIFTVMGAMQLEPEPCYTFTSTNSKSSLFKLKPGSATFLWISALVCVFYGCCIGAVDEQRIIGNKLERRPSQSEDFIANDDVYSDHDHSGFHSTLTEISHLKTEINDFNCHVDDKDCEKDKLGFEAIKGLHHLIDDDQNGNVDLSESDEFLRDELQYTDGFERQELFHNNDKLISVDDLWKSWKHSAVYNWTVDDMIEWLVQEVDLPQYSQVFYNFAIDGSALPRLVNSTSPLLSTLGIRNPVHKQKISLKAMDTILFGAPKRLHSYAKDVMLFMAVLLAIGISWFACLHHRYSQTQVKKMMKDLEALQNAEDALKKLSKELADAEKPQSSMLPESQEELRMLRQNSLRLQVPRLSGSSDRSPSRQIRETSPHYKREGEIKLKQAEEELANLRKALSDAENRLEIQQQLESQWSVPGELQAWLQLTYELEQVHFNAKRQAAERQLLAARDGCEKVRKRKQALFGALRMAHSNSLDDIDQSILDARAALEEVKQDLQERLHRWHTVEVLCCFPVISNPGLATLKQLLGRDPGNTSRLQTILSPVTFEESEEDIPTADENRPSENVYNQIPERQRQQIFAWAHRSRHSYWTKKQTNGHTAPSVPAGNKMATFLKQQTTANSGSHKANSLGASNAKSDNLDGDLQVSSLANMPATSNAGPIRNTAIFNLGESFQHERSHSSASLTHFTTLLVNQGQNQAKVASNPGALATSGLRVSNSSGNLLTSKIVTKPGNSNLKLNTSASGNHLSVKVSQPHPNVHVTSTNQPHLNVHAMSANQPHPNVHAMSANQPHPNVHAMSANQPHPNVHATSANQPHPNVHATSAIQSQQNVHMSAGNGVLDATSENFSTTETKMVTTSDDQTPDSDILSNMDDNEISESQCEFPNVVDQSHAASKIVEKVENGNLAINSSQGQILSSPDTDSLDGGAGLFTGKIHTNKKTRLPKFLQKSKKKQKI